MTHDQEAVVALTKRVCSMEIEIKGLTLERDFAIAVAARLRAAVQLVREDSGWCPVCDGHHYEPTEECP